MDQLPATSDEVFTLPIGSRLDLSHQAFVFCVLACSLAKNPRKASARLPGLPLVDEPGSGFVARRRIAIFTHLSDYDVAVNTASSRPNRQITPRYQQPMDEIAQPIRPIGSFSGSVAKHASAAVLAMGHWIQQRFSAFADVPYENPLNRQEWEDIWESDPQWNPNDGGPDKD